jgi:hypothetical protein
MTNHRPRPVAILRSAQGECVDIMSLSHAFEEQSAPDRER